ncbi:MAG: hypothetical protein K2M96_04235 [Prevotella sp.]|nr:hypothetical protein [Prevotella sp.]
MRKRSCRLGLHPVPTHSASCPDVLRTMCRHAPHHAPTASAPCTDALRTPSRRAPDRQRPKSSGLSTFAETFCAKSLAVSEIMTTFAADFEGRLAE